MPSKFLIAASIASFIVLASAAPPAGAQSTQEQTQPTGRTSGPAAGTPTHMGSGATSSPETKHQSEAVGEQSQSVKGDQQQGSGSTQQGPGSPGTGEPAKSGTEAGPSPRQPSR